MQPILTADSFRLNWGQFQCQFVCAGFSDAVKTADLSVMCTRIIMDVVLMTSIFPVYSSDSTGWIKAAAESRAARDPDYPL